MKEYMFGAALLGMICAIAWNSKMMAEDIRKLREAYVSNARIELTP